MRFQIIFFTTILIFTILLSGCPSSTVPPPNSATTSNTNTNAPNNAANNGIVIPTKKAEAPTENNAPTITPVVKAYYDALKKKDDAALKKVLTQDFIKSVEADMKDEKKTSIAAFMAEYEVFDKPVEVRNEKIEGDKASAEIKGGTYVNWTKFNFVKENGEWKFTNQFEDNEKMK
jgi:hypothetical protein